MSFSRRFIRRCSCGFRIKITKENPDFVHGDAGHPFTAACLKGHTLKSAAGSNRFPCVGAVLAVGRRPDIFPPVIKPIIVPMVITFGHCESRPNSDFSMHVNGFVGRERSCCATRIPHVSTFTPPPGCTPFPLHCPLVIFRGDNRKFTLRQRDKAVSVLHSSSSGGRFCLPDDRPSVPPMRTETSFSVQ